MPICSEEVNGQEYENLLKAMVPRNQVHFTPAYREQVFII
jgi:hypothetical protein